MGDSFYIVRNKKMDKAIETLIHKYGLTLRYQNRKEQIFSGEVMLISRQKGYTFLRLFSENATLSPDVKRTLQL